MKSDRCACVSTLAAEPAPIPQAREDLAKIPWNYPLAQLNEYQAGLVLGVSVKWLRRQRCEGTGPRYRKLNGCTVRYRLSDLLAWIESQPAGGGAVAGEREKRRGPGRPRKTAPAA